MTTVAQHDAPAAPDSLPARPPLVALDMAGTTIADDGAVIAAFEAAARALGLQPGTVEWDDAIRYVVDTMGQSKIVVFRHVFGSESRAREANDAFERSYAEAITEIGVTPIPGAADAIETLRTAGTRVVLTTGFSAETQRKIIDAVGWADVVDAVYCPADAGGRGRPFPDMILRAALDSAVDDVREIVVLGDTASDMLSGLRSGARRVLGVRTGAHDEKQLLEAGASAVLDSVAQLPGWLADGGARS
ncbi:phosphonatase-like hydrolase [Gordonia sp. (in: high G+C Gram-positive bacteria)]|uniref:phosphonatase-like hydrolase n=1 Tax=Gordonia sp. (in: high G+C Gram-positive bacteria) TaxID=84139 RepID=UPI0039E2BBC5